MAANATSAVADRHEEWDRLRATYLRSERPTSSAGGVHHVALVSSDVEATIEFYQEAPEFPLTERWTCLVRHRSPMD